jgi:hypothetical protein
VCGEVSYRCHTSNQIAALFSSISNNEKPLAIHLLALSLRDRGAYVAPLQSKTQIRDRLLKTTPASFLLGMPIELSFNIYYESYI